MNGEIYICCSKTKADLALFGEIRKFLSPLGAGGSRIWHREQVRSGTLVEAIEPALRRASCVLVLVSQDLLDDEEVFEVELEFLDAFRRRGGPVFWIALSESTITASGDDLAAIAESADDPPSRLQQLGRMLVKEKRIWPDKILGELEPMGRRALLAKLGRALRDLASPQSGPTLGDPPGPILVEPIEIERPREVLIPTADDLRSLPAFVDRKPQNVLFGRIMGRSALRRGANIVIVPSLEADAPKLLVSRLKVQVQMDKRATAQFGTLESKRVEWLWNDDIDPDDPDPFAQLLDITLSGFNPRPGIESVLGSAAPLAETFRRRNILIWTTISGVPKPTRSQRLFLARYISWWMTLPLTGDVYPIVVIFLEHSERKLPREGFGNEEARYDFARSKTGWGDDCLSSFDKASRPVALDPLSAVTAEDLDAWTEYVGERKLSIRKNAYLDVCNFIKPGQSKPLREVELRFLTNWLDEILPIQNSSKG